MKRDAGDRIGVSFQNMNLFAGGHVPNADRLIIAGRREMLAIMAECDASDRARMALEVVQHLAGSAVPKLHFAKIVPVVAEESADAARRCNQTARGTECDRGHWMGVAGVGEKIAMTEPPEIMP